jgi:hypothetical protein
MKARVPSIGSMMKQWLASSREGSASLSSDSQP